MIAVQGGAVLKWSDIYARVHDQPFLLVYRVQMHITFALSRLRSAAKQVGWSALLGGVIHFNSSSL